MRNPEICFEELHVCVRDNLESMASATEEKDWEGYMYWERQTFLTLGHHAAHVVTDDDRSNVLNAFKLYWNGLSTFSRVY